MTLDDLLTRAKQEQRRATRVERDAQSDLDARRSQLNAQRSATSTDPEFRALRDAHEEARDRLDAADARVAELEAIAEEDAEYLRLASQHWPTGVPLPAY